MGVQSSATNSGLLLMGAFALRAHESVRFPALIQTSFPRRGSVRPQAHSPCPNRLSFQKSLHIERLFSFEHEVNGSAQLVSDNGEGYCLSMLAHQAIMVPLSRWIISEEKACGFRKCPFHVDISYFSVSGAVLFPCRFSERFDQSGIGDKILYPREPGDLMDLIEERE